MKGSLEGRKRTLYYVRQESLGKGEAAMAHC